MSAIVQNVAAHSCMTTRNHSGDKENEKPKKKKEASNP